MANTNVNGPREQRRTRNVLVFSLILFVVVTFIGILGYRYLFGMEWFDSIYSAVVVLSTLSLEGRIGTPAQRIFIMFYSFVAGIVYLTIATHAIQELIQLYEEGREKQI
jgi:hypothetical protein